MMNIKCTNCGRPFPEEGVPYRCPVCGGIYDYAALPAFNPAQVDPSQPGIWRYRHTFGLPETASVITMGEGSTPLEWTETAGRKVALKLESSNPTGSHKDRGVALLVSFLKARGVNEAVEDSSGNAGASFAGYARHAGLKAKIFIPDYASGPKRQQIYDSGAEVVRILGTRTMVTEAVQRAAAQGAVYASHASLPHLIPGYATIAFELFEQLGEAPGCVLVPAGQGTLLLGILRGFVQLHKAGMIPRVPLMLGVQALACAPLWTVVNRGPAALSWVTEGETVAEGVRVFQPVRGDQILNELGDQGGTFVAVPEDAILPARNQLAARGFKVEPTSALVWDAFNRLAKDLPEPAVLILTGAGFKSNIPFE